MSEIQNFDDILEDDVPAAIGHNILAEIGFMAKAQEKAEAEVERLENELELAKKNLANIRDKNFPELLDSLSNTTDITVDGVRVQLAKKLRGSIPKQNQDQAFAWLTDNGHGGIVKRKIVIEFNKDEEAWAKKFLADCRKRKKQLNMTIDRSVHHSTLQAWASEMLGNGEDIPRDLLGIFEQRFTKITRKEESEQPF